MKIANKSIPGRVDRKTNCLTEWVVPHWPAPLCFSGWGCEIGNWFGFFAHERVGGLACKIKNRDLDASDQHPIRSAWRIALPKALFNVEVQDEWLTSQHILRTLNVQNVHERISWIGDAVIRLAIPWEEGLTAEVEGQRIVHEDRNFYFDTEEATVSLCWPDGRRLKISWSENMPTPPPPFTPYLYVRDQPAMPEYGHTHCLTRAWVVHARLIVEHPAAFVYRWGRNPLVFWNRGVIGRFLVSPPRLGCRWRAAEWKVKGRGTLYGLWPLLSSQTLSLGIEIITE